MTFNSELAYQVLEQIKLHPEEHTQGDWRCGTGMCFAGWAAEIHGVRWLAKNPDSVASAYVVVPEDFLAEHGLDREAWMLGYPDDEQITLKEGEVVISVRAYARVLLGLTRDEASVLFASRNSRSAITQMVKALESGDEELLEEARKTDTDFDDPAEYTTIEDEGEEE